ncbi:GNAT family N-acetyltransferase [Algoriphagus antarcticus]|uniref:RimJ/RimL family protein N-acetyltransferase n=1 Tax=Algoriphagus antarcticus TaxID=238540 RepID=A0A3E0DI36_9BACT|nr:GNAT family N-acetyltransferase [Algoriphagus antarcticus]REG82285.1 RimJ/RimL family protein N-acetyltransferase [Algoriphagus antarcticus]
MKTILPARTTAEYTTIADLANRIWFEHFGPIIGEEQVSYMLQKFQSVLASEDQVEKGMRYYLLLHQAVPVGYFAFSRKEESLFLSKLYVLDSMRGMGMGRLALTFIEAQAIELQLKKIELTVNKYNSSSIQVYEKMGFITIDSIVQDIGNGYVMDDYVLEKSVI